VEPTSLFEDSLLMQTVKAENSATRDAFKHKAEGDEIHRDIKSVAGQK